MMTEAAPRRRLSRDRVVTAALAIVDRDGLASLTMRALGRELHVDPMAVYHWVPRKSVLLDLIVEAVLADIPLNPEGEPGDWRERLTDAAASYRDTLRRHPNTVQVLATRPATSTAAMLPAEFAIGLLRDAGFSPEIALYCVGVVSNFVLGIVLAEVGVPPGVDEDLTDQERAAAFDALTRERFPHLLEAYASVDYSFDAQFALGMDALTRGMEHLLAEPH